MSKGLEALKRITLKDFILNNDSSLNDIKVIEQELKEYERLKEDIKKCSCWKEHKALEIIKENFMLVEKMYDTKLVIKIPLTQEEYNLLKEIML